MNRREFLGSGVTAGFATSSSLLPGGRLRFRLALRRAIDIKLKGSEQAARISRSLMQAVNVDGHEALVVDHVYDDPSVVVPFWRNILNWILENWELILKILLTLITILETQ